LSGRISWLITADGQTDRYSIKAGRFGFYACPGKRYCATCTAQEGTEILQLLFPYSTLTALLGDRRLPPELAAPNEGTQTTGIVREISPPMNSIIGSILDALRHEHGSTFFLLAKAFELLWLFCNSRFTATEPSASTEDYKAIQKTLIILQNNLEAPPSLAELANQVGMSTSKLKNLFPRMCGLPPYEFLRKMRMEKAMKLLAHGGVNVTEAALEVGYSSISHFSKAFYKAFAVYPSQVRQGRHPPRVKT
jgi:AraC-like DNA-binding protein